MSKTQVNLQDVFLNLLRKDGTPLTIYLINGFQLKGIVKAFDNFTVLLEGEGKQMLVYKHAISTVSPMRSVVNLVSELRKEMEQEGRGSPKEDSV
ncbi:MAG TPA: RNA chaperone Hfq [Clostridia bacterium]|nr:RNA chaperone Hfq [Clostridia bacterium]